MRPFIAAIAIALVPAAESPAFADGYARTNPIGRFETAPLIAQPLESARTPYWYGGQLLAVDGVVFALGALTLSTEPILTVLPALGYFAGGPMIHGAHDRGGVAFGSLGLRVGGPIVGLALGSALSKPDGPFTCNDTCVAGLLAGYVGAILIDAAALAWERRPAAPPSTPQQLAFVPSAAINRDSSVVSVHAIF